MAKTSTGRNPLGGLVGDVIDGVGDILPGSEDTTPRDTLPNGPQQPENKPRPGWQSPPMPVVETPMPCPHIGWAGASLSVNRYELGAEWACTCGQLFVVAINKGGKRTLRKKEDVAVDGLVAEADPNV